MRSIPPCLFLLGALAGECLAMSSPHIRARKIAAAAAVAHRSSAANSASSRPTASAAPESFRYLTSKTKKYFVDGTKIPDVNFDIGESYAGLLPAAANTTSLRNSLYFWFFPSSSSSNPLASNELVIWLNGGPGCSSLEGLIQENGPFLWQSGTYAPQRNPFSWTNLTNVVYVDQPIGTGFSPAAEGEPGRIVDEERVARDFGVFWRNFVGAFGMQGRKIYLTGESFAGQYIPYIAKYMLDANDTEHFNLKGILINDPAFNEDDVLFQAPAVAHLNAYANIFNLNATFTASVNARADSCGYTPWLERALRYPPQGHIPSAPSSSVPGCDVYTDIVNAALLVNPCFNVDHLTDFCPYLWDILGFPSLGAGPDDYFARADVQKAINAPRTPDWAVCGNPTLGLNFQDHSPPAGLPSGPLGAVIERTGNVVVAHGSLDYLLLINGTLATIQNLTWHGRQGFHVAPSSWEEFYVPYGRNLAYAIDALTHQSVPEKSLGLVGGAGVMGRTHSERGLTFVEVWNSGHELAQYNPAAAFRLLEFLLGRVERLDVKGGGFSTEREAR